MFFDSSDLQAVVDFRTPGTSTVIVGTTVLQMYDAQAIRCLRQHGNEKKPNKTK
jgi:hypothetical protein